MVNNVIRFIVDVNGNLLEQPQGRFRANNNTVDKVQFIAPFDIADSVSMTFTKPSFPDLTQYNVITTLKGADVVEENNPLYQTVATYNVWEVGVKDTILAFISKYRNTDIKVSFQIGSIEPNSKCLSFEGYFGVDSDLPTEDQEVGDYYACEDIEFVMADNGNGRSYTFGKGMYVYWNGSYWVKVRLAVKQNVNATDIPVEANAGQGYELEEDEVNYLEGIASTGVSNETRITALEDTQEDIISGVQEIDKINWDMDAVNENDLEIGESAYIDGILKTRLNDSVVLSHGEEQLRVRRNNTGATLNDFVPVYVTGAVGQRVTVALAGTGVTDILSKQIEVMTQDLENNSNGYSNKSGEVKRTNTIGSQFGETWNDGDVIYLGATAGTMTNVEPTAPTPKIRLGHVVYAHGTNGVFEVDVRYVSNLGDLSNVDLTGAVENDTVKRNALGVYVTDDRVTSLVNSNLIKEWDYAPSTGIVTLTYYDDTTATIDLPLELIIESGYYDEANNNLVLVLANGDEIDIPVGNLLTDLDAVNIRYSNGDSSLIAVNVKTAIDELDEKIVNLDSGDIAVGTSESPSGVATTQLGVNLDMNANKVNLFLNQPLEDLNGHSLKEVFDDGCELTKEDISLKRSSKRTQDIFFDNILSTGSEYYYNITVTDINLATNFTIVPASPAVDYFTISTLGFGSDEFIASGTENRLYAAINTSNPDDDAYYVDFTINCITNKSYFGITIDKEKMDYYYKLFVMLEDYGEAQALSLKADITQEDWIEPTLTNATSTYLKYRKDNFGTIIIEGNLTVTTVGTNFTLPTGYRPLFTYVNGDLTFNTDGTVVSSSTGLKYLSVRFTGGVS